MRKFRLTAILVCLFVSLPCALRAECRVTKENVDGDTELVMENSYLRIRLKPSLGGVISGFYDKQTRTEFTGGIPQGNIGICEDLTWQPDTRSWYRSAYQFQILRAKGGEAAVRLWRRPPTGFYSFVTISKTIRLKQGSKSVRIDYQITNAVESMNSISFPLWLHNMAYVRDKEATYFMPTVNGVEKYRTDRKKHGDAWVYEPSRGWSGMVTEDGHGLAATMDFTRIYALYDWFGANISSIEWRYVPASIEAGGEFRTSVTFAPFSALKRIDHASPDLVCEIELKERLKTGEPIRGKLKIAPVKSMHLEITPRLRPDVSAKWKSQKTVRLSVKTGAAQTIPFSFNAIGKEALAAVGFRIRSNNRELAVFEKPVFIGKRVWSKKDYTYAPIRQRVRTAKPRSFIPFTPKDNIKSPHIKWYKPYAKKAPKALFVISWEGLRSVLELAQRASIDLTTVTSRHGEHGHKDCRMGWYPPPGATIPYYIDSAVYYKNLDPSFTDQYDVIVISNASRGSSQILWKNFTEYTASRLREMVTAGTGLVVIYPKNLTPEWEALHKKARKLTDAEKDTLLTGIPFDRIPLFSADQIRVSKLGKGRVVFFNYKAGGMMPYLGRTPEPSHPYYEYCYLALTRAIYWAANREPALTLKSLDVAAKPVQQDNVSASPITARLASEKVFNNITAELVISDYDGKDVYSKTQQISVSAMATTVTWKMPVLKTGEHTARTRFLSGDKILTSGAASFRVESALAVRKVTLASNTLNPGGTLKGWAECAGNGSPDGLKLKIEIIDTWKRICRRKTLPLAIKDGAGRVDFSIQIGRPLSVLHTLRCTIMRNNVELSAETAEFTVPSLTETWDDFDANFWMCSDDQPPFIKRLRMDRMRELGFSTVFKVISSGESAFRNKATRPERAAKLGEKIDAFVRPIVASNMRVIVSGLWGGARDHHYPTNRPKKHPVRVPCLSDKDYLDALRYQVAAYENYGWRWGTMRYITADETSLGHYRTAYDLCWSPKTISEFREWLKKLYGGLASLNAEWETTFKEWKDVVPMTEKDAEKRANIAPWLDFRIFLDDVFTRPLTICREGLSRRNKNVGFGASGTSPSHPYNGHDWFKIMKAYNAVNTYRESKIYQSFTPKARFSSWTGYRKPPAVEWNLVWRWVLMGQAGWAIWTDDYMVLPDLNFTGHYAPTAAGILDKFRGGLGKQLSFVCERPNDGVAIHWSKPSLAASYMQKYREDHSMFLRKVYSYLHGIFEPGDYPCLFDDMGFEYRYIASPQVESGELNSGKWKVLLLPMAMALSDREVKEMGKFVESGGVLVADCMTGIYDEHGKPRKTGALDDLFGIKRDQKGKRLSFKPTVISGSKQKASILENGISVKDGTPLAYLGMPGFKVGDYTIVDTSAGNRRPIAITKRTGRGRTVYFGFIGDYHAKRAKDAALLNLYEKWLNLDSLKSGVRLTDANGEPVVAQISRFRAGKARFLAFFRDAEFFLNEYKSAGDLGPDRIKQAQERQSRSARVEIPDARHVYDVNRGKYLGRTKVFNVKLLPGHAELMALLPYKVTALKLKAPENIRAGETLTLGISICADEIPGKHVVNVKVTGPDNKELPCYEKNYVTQKGTASVELPIAHNAVAGAYSIHVRDVPTGQKAEVRFTVSN